MIAAAVWLTAVAIVPGRLPHTDDAYFKEPGYQLSAHGRLISPALAGYGDIQPDLSELFASYQPGYPVAYACWLAIFPHSFRAAVAFDALIRFLLVVTLVLALPLLISRTTSNAAAMVGAAACLLGTPGRPDELAMVLGYWGLTCWLRDAPARASRTLLGGVCLGLCGATSLPVLMILLLWGGSLLLVQQGASRVGSTILRSLPMAVVALATLAAILVPYYARPGAWAQYLAMSQQHFLAWLPRVWEGHTLAPYAAMVKSSCRSMVFALPLHAAIVGALAVGLARGSRAARGPVVAGLAAYAFIWVAFPQQYLYFWFVLPALLVAARGATLGMRLWNPILATTVLLAANPQGRDFVKTILIPPGQQIGDVRRTVAAIVPQDSALYASAKSYFLFRPGYPGLRVDHWPDWSALREAEYVVFGSWLVREKDGVWLPLGIASSEAVEYLRTNFKIVHNGLPTTKPVALGIPIGSEPVGYGVVIYKRAADL